MDERIGNFKLGLDSVPMQQREKHQERHPVQRMIEEVG